MDDIPNLSSGGNLTLTMGKRSHIRTQNLQLDIGHKYPRCKKKRLENIKLSQIHQRWYNDTIIGILRVVLYAKWTKHGSQAS